MLKAFTHARTVSSGESTTGACVGVAVTDVGASVGSEVSAVAGVVGAKLGPAPGSGSPVHPEIVTARRRAPMARRRRVIPTPLPRVPESEK